MISLYQLLVNESIKKDHYLDTLSGVLLGLNTNSYRWSIGKYLPSDVSKFDSVDITTFNPKENAAWIMLLPSDDEAWVFLPHRGSWNRFDSNTALGKGGDPKFNKIKLKRAGGVLYKAPLESPESDAPGIELDEKKVKLWINKTKNTVFAPIGKSRRWWDNKVQKFPGLFRGTDLIHMENFGKILVAVIDPRGDMMPLDHIIKLFGTYRVKDINHINTETVRNILKKVEGEMDESLYTALVEYTNRLDEMP